MEVILPIAVILALVSTFASWRWLYKWQDAEKRLAEAEFEAEFEQFMMSIAAEFWQNYHAELKQAKRDRCAVPTVPPVTADLYVKRLHAGRFWMN